MKITALSAFISVSALAAASLLSCEVVLAVFAVAGVGFIAVFDYSRSHRPLLVNASASAIKRRLTSALRLAA